MSTTIYRLALLFVLLGPVLALTVPRCAQALVMLAALPAFATIRWTASRTDYLHFLACFGIPISVCISYFLHPTQDLRQANTSALLFLGFPLYSVFKHSNLPQGAFFWGLAMAGCASLCMAIATHTEHHLSTVTHFTAYGTMLALVLVGIAALATRPWQLLFLMPTLTALLFTSSRGAWAAALGGLLVVAILKASSWRQSAINCLACLAAFALLATTDLAQKRFEEARSDISTMHSEIAGTTSLGARYILWQTAWEMFEKRPFFGFGMDQFKTYLDTSRPGQNPQNLGVAHSEVLHLLATQGLFGLSFWVFLFASQVYLFWQHRNPYSIFGLATLAIFCVGGMSNCNFMHTAYASFFVFTLMATQGLAQRYRLVEAGCFGWVESKTLLIRLLTARAIALVVKKKSPSKLQVS